MDLSRSPRKKMQAVLGQYHRSGFSLVEVLVAAMLLAISASAALTLFSVSEALFTQGKTQDDDQAINTDLAEIQQRNRRFTCMEGSCTLSDFDPNENQYTPIHPGIHPPGSSFEQKQLFFAGKEDSSTARAIPGLCSYYHPARFPNIPPGTPSKLIEEFNRIALSSLPPMPPEFKRDIDINTPASETPQTPHAYVVIYSKKDDNNNTQILRRARFVPTVAGWCP